MHFHNKKEKMVDNKDKVQIKEIVYSSEEYSLEVELRDRVLRKPLGMNLYDENLEKEQQDIHIGAFINGTLAGVLILTRLSTIDVKMRQVAVTAEVRGERIGTELVLFAEKYSKNKGFTTMLLHARKTAVGFYEKLGYEKVSEEFLEINIPHYQMRKYLS